MVKVDANLAEQLARRLQTSLEQVVREENELLILRGLLESEIGSRLIFKGGTALRLAYGSPRFSDDLDFSARDAIPARQFRQIAQACAAPIAAVSLVEALGKRFTLFAMYRVKESFLAQAFSIKVEISMRPQTWTRNTDYELRLLTSEATNVSVLAQVATLNRLWQDKQAAFADRHEPRDVYDLWFIAQKLKHGFALDLAGVNRKRLRSELRKYLPQNHWGVIDQWSD